MQLSELDWTYVQERAAYFTGRAWVFARLNQFIHEPPGVFLLLGEPGTGKTAVAAQLALAAAGRLAPAATGEAPRPAVPVAAAYFCRAGRVDLLDAAQRLSDQLAQAVPGFARARQATLVSEVKVGKVKVRTGKIAAGGSATGIRIDLSRLQAETAFVQAVTLPLKRMREAGDSTQVLVLIDALDESLASQTAKELPRLLGDVENAHLVVTARPDRRASSWLWDRAARVDLVVDAPPGSHDVLEYLQSRLTLQGEPAAMAILAQRIAEQAGGNFLYAFYIIEALLDADVLAALDAAAARGVQLPKGGLSGVYRAFLRRELWRDDRDWSTRFRPVLAPLAVAQDEGLTTEQLRLVAGRLAEQPMTRTAIREVTHAARQFLDGPAPDGPFRVYHQSFADFLISPEQNPDFLIDAAETHQAIVAAYAAIDPLSWDDYARRNLALHASKVRRLDHLLKDARFLLAADSARLVTHLDTARSARARATAAVYRQSAHVLGPLDPPGRASQLELSARYLGHSDLAPRIGACVPGRPWQTRWCQGRVTRGHQTLVGYGVVEALATAVLPDGTPIITGATGGGVRVWRLADGLPHGRALTGHDGAVSSVATSALPDGTPVIISGGQDGTVRVWRLVDGVPHGRPLTGHDGPVRAVATSTLPDGTPVIISGGQDGTVRIWRLADGARLGKALTANHEAVLSVASGTLPDGTPIIISGGDDGVCVWRLADGGLLGEQPAEYDGDEVMAVATGEVADGIPVMISGRYGGMVDVWGLSDGAPRWERAAAHDGMVTDLTSGALPDGTPVIISGGYDGTVRIWNIADGAARGELLIGHDGPVTAVAAGALPDGRPVIISAGDDGTVRIWRHTYVKPHGQPPTGHHDLVMAVTSGELPDGTPVIISGGRDASVRTWHLADGAAHGESLGWHSAAVNAVATSALPDGTPVIISGSDDCTVRIWRLADGARLGKPLTGNHEAVLSVATGTLPDGTPVVISGGRDTSVRIWRLGDGAPHGHPLMEHEGQDGPAWAVATGMLPDGTPVIISGHFAMVRIWRLADGAPLGKPLTGHDGPVNAVATGTLPDGTSVIVSGGDDAAVRIWRLADGAPLGKPLTGHGGPVNAVATGTLADGTPVIFSGGYDAAVRIWRLADGCPVEPALWLPTSIHAIATHGDHVITASGTALMVHWFTHHLRS
jgi:WD40 repeat protein